MPPDLDEATIDVGDEEEKSTDVRLSSEEETSEVVEPLEKASASNEELEEYSSNVKGRINDLTKRFRVCRECSQRE